MADIELDELLLEETEVSRDNIDAIRRSLEKIELLLSSLEERVTALE